MRGAWCTGLVKEQGSFISERAVVGGYGVNAHLQL
jgi:hypothetical protein